MLDFDTLFKNHVATREDYGPLSVITYQNPKNSMYGLRFIFDNDWSTLTITGDSLNAIFTNCNNMGSPDRLYQTIFASNKQAYPYGDYKLSYDIGYLADKSRTKIVYTNNNDIDYNDIMDHIETTLNIVIDDYVSDIGENLIDAFEAFASTLEVYIRSLGTTPKNAKKLYTIIGGSLNHEDYSLIEDYLEENYFDVTMNDLIDIPLPVNENLVLIFEGFKRAYEALEKQTN